MCVISVRAGLKKMTLAMSVSFKVGCGFVSLSCFSGQSFPFFSPLLNVSFGANFNQIIEVNL